MEKKKKGGKRSRWARLHSIIFCLLAVAVVVGAVHLISAATLDRRLVYTELGVSTGNPALRGYQIAFITDTHAITHEELAEIVEELDARGTDLVLLGGDYAEDGTLQQDLDALGASAAPDGVWAVDGNHDEWWELAPAMERAGIHLFDNSGVQIAPGLYIAGVRDLWYGRPGEAAATEGAQPGDFVLLVSHNPDVAMQQDMDGVGLVLSGHTHGGQVTLFGVFKPLLATVTEYGGRFGGGWAEGADGVPVYVSRGTGYVQSVPRVFSRPEVVYITLVV